MRVLGAVCLSCCVIGLTCALALAAPRPGIPPLRPIHPRAATLPVPGPQPELIADKIVIKLTAEFAREATALPELGLPTGLAEFDEMLSRHGIEDGFRLRQTRGRPIRDMELFRKIGIDRMYVLRLTDADEEKIFDLIHELSGESWVEYAGPVYNHVPLFSPNDPLYPQQWPHNNTGQSPGNGTADADMDSPEAWDTNVGTAAGAVAILDSGIQMSGTEFTHPDLADNIDPAEAYDYVSNDPYPQDTNGHGTSAAGIAAAVGNNALGVAGLCQGCRIFPKKVSSSTDDANAIMDSADAGAASTNMSHTFGCNWLLDIKDAADYALGLGTVNVASAANFNGYTCSVPAALPGVISAGGTNANDQRIYTYSDYSEVSAAGSSAWSTALGSGYTLFGGTSASSPFIAGLAGLLKSERTDLTGNQLRHIIRLGAEDEVSNPDPPGWDIQMGWGRINAARSMALLDARWIALDRGHYTCESQAIIGLQDPAAGQTIDVTIEGDVNGDVETVTLTKVAGSTDYYEGTIPFNWADVFGLGTAGDGMLDVSHEENLSASDGIRTAEAFMDCVKEVCRTPLDLNIGDCDGDGAADPGETRTLPFHLVNLQTEIMEDASLLITSNSPWIEVLSSGVTFGDVLPFNVVSPGSQGPVIRIRPGAPADTTLDVEIKVFGRGWDSDDTGCADSGYTNDTLTLRVNRDKGTPTGVSYTFDSGTQGFSTATSHGTGDLPECPGGYVDPWSGFPGTTHVHSGGRAWGMSAPYPDLSDGALVSAPFTVPAGGGVLGWYQWVDIERQEIGGFNVYFTWDGMVLEAKRTADLNWTYLDDASYNHEQWSASCNAEFPFGATLSPRTEMFSGDGPLSEIQGDNHDREWLADLSDLAGEEIQVRWRMGSDVNTVEGGVWIDTITLYNEYTADSWPADAPEGLSGSDVGCDVQFELMADPVPGASGYQWYRSEVSCLDASLSDTPVGSTAGPFFIDTAVNPDVEYFYAIDAIEDGTTCTTVRACVAGGCCMSPPEDPTITAVSKSTTNVLFTLGYGGVFADVYRDPNPNPANWGGVPHDSQISDESQSDSDFQYADVGGVAAGTLQYYIFTGSRCGNTLPPG